MQLKRIELEGFKSFADRTVIQIERGLTGIVGPNGCGKSNVVDALRWVMGERSAKTLRADEMLDVVFKGASGRGEAPYAMVEIILSDEEGQVAEAGAEVAVGRRLFRTGESEYLLNGRKSKRKEVRDLLMDTGLGVRSYMVLAQGKIDAVLSQNPAERRSVFEEAAGISRYKARKHEAELKLARVRQDLERVEDVHAEVQRSVRSLKYQASKAERYIQARDGYREAKIRHAWVESARFREEEAQFLKSTDELECAVQELRTRREEADARLKSLEEEADTLRERHDHLRQEAATSRQEAATLEERVRGWDQQASDLEARHEREHERLSGLSDEDEGRQELSQTLADEQRTLTQARVEVQTALEAAELGFEAARKAHREVRDTMETLRAGVLESLADRTRFNNEAAVAAQTRSEAQGLLNSLKRRAGERGDEVAALNLKLNEATIQRTQAVAAFGALEAQVSELAVKVDACTRLEDSHRDAASASSAQAEEAKARLQALDAVEADQQGLPEDVRQKLEAENAQVSLLLDGVDVPAPWDRLLENLLGRMQHALWLEQEGALETLEASVDCFYPVQGNFVPMEIAGARSLSSLLKGDV
ncbi:MAG: AAA family ATPase, partial [Planctomycetes bacterium]|nr:AAA family ATPase [Planctomycetota bacterium]